MRIQRGEAATEEIQPRISRMARMEKQLLLIRVIRAIRGKMLPKSKRASSTRTATCRSKNSLTIKSGPEMGLFGRKTGVPAKENDIVASTFSLLRGFFVLQAFDGQDFPPAGTLRKKSRLKTYRRFSAFFWLCHNRFHDDWIEHHAGEGVGSGTVLGERTPPKKDETNRCKSLIFMLIAVISTTGFTSCRAVSKAPQPPAPPPG
jgi:hypothetical protein